MRDFEQDGCADRALNQLEATLCLIEAQCPPSLACCARYFSKPFGGPRHLNVRIVIIADHELVPFDGHSRPPKMNIELVGSNIRLWHGRAAT